MNRLSISIFFTTVFLYSCTTTRDLVFANREWHVSEHYGQIIDKDTTYRMTFGDVLIPNPLVIISSTDSLAKYPGMEDFLRDILHTARLDSAEILFYAPEMQTMFVRSKHDMAPVKPSSISSPLDDESPYTMWIYCDDVEDWIRKPKEMYTNTYYNKGKKQLLIVDYFDYGDTPVAQITVFQSRTKKTDKMSAPDIPETIRRSFYTHHDLKNYMNDIEFWSANVESRRKRAFANYKIGVEQKSKGKIP